MQPSSAPSDLLQPGLGETPDTPVSPGGAPGRAESRSGSTAAPFEAMGADGAVGLDPGFGAGEDTQVFPSVGQRCWPDCRPAGEGYRPFGRHCGRGNPLLTESWLHRPFSAGWSMGFVQGSPLTSDWRAGEQQGFLGVFRLGWDRTHHWGSETRLSFDTMKAESLQWDLDLLYYPWGDSRWRPYLMAGVGVATVSFAEGFSPSYDQGLSPSHDETVFALPLAIGLKYRCTDWLALRLEVGDNVLFGEGSQLKTLVNLSVTGGFEVRFGGARKSYWPWNPGRSYW